MQVWHIEVDEDSGWACLCHRHDQTLDRWASDMMEVNLYRDDLRHRYLVLRKDNRTLGTHTHGVV